MRLIEAYWWVWLLVAILPIIGIFVTVFLDILFEKLDFMPGRKAIAHIFIRVATLPLLIDISISTIFYSSWLFLFLIGVIKIIRYATH